MGNRDGIALRLARETDDQCCATVIQRVGRDSCGRAGSQKQGGGFQSGLDSWCEETGGGGSGWSFGGAAMGLFLLDCHDEKSHPTVNQQ